MNRQITKQLKHHDPAQRTLAIKALARDKDRTALKQLAIMCEDDADREVRELARRAGVYIRQQIGELPTAAMAIEAEDDDKPDTSGNRPKVPVAEKNEAEAHHLLNIAMSHQMNGEKSKAVKVLEKALRLNPNLRFDGFFISLAEAATGEIAQDAIALLSDSDRHSSIAQQETRERQRKMVESHMEKVSRVRWADVGFDLGLYFVLVAVCALITLFLAGQTAQGFVQKVDENAAAVQEAELAGDFTEQDGELIYHAVNEDGQRITFTAIEPEAAFLQTARTLSEITFMNMLIASLVISLLSVATVAALACAAHCIAAFIFRRRGTLRYLAHQAASLFTTRTIVLFVLMWVGTLLIFEAEGGMMVTIVAGAIGLLLLVVVLNLVAITSKSYNTSFMPGLVATLGGLIVMLLLGGLGTLLLPGILSTTV
jgi:HEAT repeat protein